MYNSQTEIANRHDFNKTFTAEYTSNQTAQAIITPASGKRLKIKHANCVGPSTDGKARFYFSADTDGNENTVNILYGGGGGILNFIDDIYIVGGIDQPLRITTTFGDSDPYFVSVAYREE